jgi:hypothetical protein
MVLLRIQDLSTQRPLDLEERAIPGCQLESHMSLRGDRICLSFLLLLEVPIFFRCLFLFDPIATVASCS